MSSVSQKFWTFQFTLSISNIASPFNSWSSYQINASISLCFLTAYKWCLIFLKNFGSNLGITSGEHVA